MFFTSKVAKIFITLTTIFLLTGCMRPITEFSASEVSQNVTYTSDPYSSLDTYVGMRVGGYEYMIGTTYYRVRSFKAKSGIITSHQIYVDIGYTDGWQFYDKASLLGGKTLETDVISRDVTSCNSYGCDFNEIIGINLSDEEFRSYASTGMKIKLYAKSGHTRMIDVTPNYIQGQLSAIK